MTSDGNAASRCRVLDNTYRNAVYNWLSFEVLAGQTPTEYSDLYSYCVIIWELLHGMHSQSIAIANIYCWLNASF